MAARKWEYSTSTPKKNKPRECQSNPNSTEYFNGFIAETKRALLSGASDRQLWNMHRAIVRWEKDPPLAKHTYISNPKNLDHYLERSVKGDIQTRWLNFCIHSTSCNNENDRILRQLRLILAAGRMLELMHIVCAVTLARHKKKRRE